MSNSCSTSLFFAMSVDSLFSVCVWGEKKVALLFVSHKCHVFDPLRSNQTVSVCHGPVQPAGEIYSLIPARGRMHRATGG